MLESSWIFFSKEPSKEEIIKENQILKNQIQELLSLEETGFFIELDSLLKAILKKALILSKAEASFFALCQNDKGDLEVRISNLNKEEKLNTLLSSFHKKYQEWEETEAEIIPVDDFLLLPLVRRHKMLGVIGLKLNSKAPENICELLPILAKQAATSLESAILYEKMFKRLLVLSNVFILGKEIISNIDLKNLIHKFLQIARDGTNSEIAMIVISKNVNEFVELIYIQTPTESIINVEKSENYITSLIKKVFFEQKSIIIDNLNDTEYKNEEINKFAPYSIRNSLLIPLIAQEQILGVIQLANKTAKGNFTAEDLDLVKILSNQLAYVIQNADLFRNLQKAYVSTLAALTSAIDAKDTYTHGHSERVTTISIEIGKILGLNNNRIENLRLAGLLHDIGKIGIPENILNKPGRLTDEEFNIVKSHPEVGVKILNKVEFLAKIIPFILYHHERFDGRGYPHGIKGEEIPKEARIITVADSWDAMTSDRPYRKAMPKERALDEIIRSKGTQFDPEVVDAFVQLLSLKPEMLK